MAVSHYTLEYDSELKTSKWRGYPDPNYVWDGERLSYERVVKDENGKDVTVKTYKDPIEIIADFKPESKVFGVEGDIEKAAVKKFGGALKGFVWLDNVSGGGEVVLPFTAPHIFIARGDRLNPELTEISTDPNSDNYYEIVEGKTRVVVKSFSGIGGAAGAPPTLVAHYKMNDNLATTVVIDETGNYNGTAQQNTSAISVAGKINGAFDFNGTGDFVQFSQIISSFPLSISLWFNNRDITNSGVFAYLYLSSELWACIGSSSTTRIYCGVSGKGTEPNLFGNNEWHHVVLSQKNDSTAFIFLDGIDVTSTSGFWSKEGIVSQIGARNSANLFDGLVDNVMFFSRELDQHDVDFLWNNGNGREDWGLRRWFRALRGRYSKGSYRSRYR